MSEPCEIPGLTLVHTFPQWPVLGLALSLLGVRKAGCSAWGSLGKKSWDCGGCLQIAWLSLILRCYLLESISSGDNVRLMQTGCVKEPFLLLPTSTAWWSSFGKAWAVDMIRSPRSCESHIYTGLNQRRLMPSGPTPSLTNEETKAQREGGTNSRSHIKLPASGPFKILPSGAESPKEIDNKISQHLKPVSENQTVRLGLWVAITLFGPFPHLET